MYTLPEVIFLMTIARSGLIFETLNAADFGKIAIENQEITDFFKDKKDTLAYANELVNRMVEDAKEYAN